MRTTHGSSVRSTLVEIGGTLLLLLLLDVVDDNDMAKAVFWKQQCLTVGAPRHQFVRTIGRRSALVFGRNENAVVDTAKAMHQS